MNRYLKYLSAGGAAILLALTAFAFVAIVHAGTGFFAVNKTGYETYSFFSATTTSATSTNLSGGGGYFNINGARSVSVFFQRGGVRTANTGSSAFKVQGSPDGGTTWYNFGLFVSATSTTQTQFGQDVTLGGIVTLTGTTSVAYGLDVTKTPFSALRCIAVQTTDGESTCNAAAQF